MLQSFREREGRHSLTLCAIVMGEVEAWVKAPR
jgi:hypothetical protein